MRESIRHTTPSYPIDCSGAPAADAGLWGIPDIHVLWFCIFCRHDPVSVIAHEAGTDVDLISVNRSFGCEFLATDTTDLAVPDGIAAWAMRVWFLRRLSKIIQRLGRGGFRGLPGCSVLYCGNAAIPIRAITITGDPISLPQCEGRRRSLGPCFKKRSASVNCLISGRRKNMRASIGKLNAT